MSVYTKMLVQKAVYWAPTGTADEEGRQTYEAALILSCRWQDLTQEPLGKDGRAQASKAVVYTSQDVKVDGVLKGPFLKTEENAAILTSLTSETVPLANEGAWIIQIFSKEPNMRGTKFLRKASL